MCRKILAVLALSAPVSINAFAGVPAEDMARPGHDLTPMGTEVPGSACGACELLQQRYGLTGKPLSGDYKSGISEGGKYFTPNGVTRLGIH